MAHISVLMNEVLEGLDIHPADIIVDGTINGGGHSLEISQRLSDSGILVGIDQDASALVVSGKKLRDVDPQVNLVHANFKDIDVVIKDLDLEGFDKLLLDLGWSSNQFENPDRGFSFMHDGPLLMTLSGDADSVPFTAYDIVNTWEEASLMDILEGYGEEKYAWHITQGILKKRKEEAITSTLQLAEIITESVPAKYARAAIHPATKTFQALRIAVNNEMEVLKEGLAKSFDLLSDNGRMVIISFHSIEDRIVKNFFKEKQKEGTAKIITKKPITASENELMENRRARSAKLRILEKI